MHVAPWIAVHCWQYAPDVVPDMPQMMPQTCPRWCPRNAPYNAQEMPQMMPQTCPGWCHEVVPKWSCFGIGFQRLLTHIHHMHPNSKNTLVLMIPNISQLQSKALFIFEFSWLGQVFSNLKSWDSFSSTDGKSQIHRKYTDKENCRRKVKVFFKSEGDSAGNLSCCCCVTKKSHPYMLQFRIWCDHQHHPYTMQSSSSSSWQSSPGL